MPTLARAHLNIILIVTFITGLFAGADWLQTVLLTLLILSAGFGLVHLLVVPILTAFDYFIENKNDGYTHGHFMLYYKLAKHYAFAIWFPFSKFAFILSEVFYASNFYRHYQDFGSEYDFSYNYHTQKIPVRPFHQMLYHKKSYRISLRYYVPPLLRKARPFQGMVVGLYEQEINSYEAESPMYILHLKVSDHLYGGLRFRETNAEDLHIILRFDQVIFIRKLLQKAEDAHSDLHLTIDMNMAFRFRLKRFFKVILTYQKGFYSKGELFHDYRQSAVNFAHNYLARRWVEDFRLHSFIPSLYYERLSYNAKVKDLKKKGALEKAPSTSL